MSAVGTAIAPAPYDVERVRADFPILSQTITGHPLVYLDNAASVQRPYQVLEAIRRYYETSHANVHRGAHRLSVRATEAYEDARHTVADHIGADAAEVVFVRGTTEGINLVAGSWGCASVGPDDEIVLTKMEHHSNLVPWQLLAERSGATLRFVDVSVGGEQLLLEDYERLLSERTRLVAVTHVSNTLGVINPVREIARLAHEAGALCLVDGAQAAPHHELDMGALGCDFYAFSGHKMCGPTGIGVLWARRELLEEMKPYQGGGEMISSVALGRSIWAEVTQQYPDEKWELSPRFRGTHRMAVHEDGRATCVACGLCPTVCPVNCIKLIPAEDENGERYAAVYEIDEFRCILCGFCQEVCPVEAIHLGVHYENSEYSRERWVYDLERLTEMDHPVTELWDPADLRPNDSKLLSFLFAAMAVVRTPR